MFNLSKKKIHHFLMDSMICLVLCVDLIACGDNSVERQLVVQEQDCVAESNNSKDAPDAMPHGPIEGSQRDFLDAISEDKEARKPSKDTSQEATIAECCFDNVRCGDSNSLSFSGWLEIGKDNLCRFRDANGQLLEQSWPCDNSNGQLHIEIPQDHQNQLPEILAVVDRSGNCNDLAASQGNVACVGNDLERMVALGQQCIRETIETNLAQLENMTPEERVRKTINACRLCYNTLSQYVGPCVPYFLYWVGGRIDKIFSLGRSEGVGADVCPVPDLFENDCPQAIAPPTRPDGFCYW